MTPDDWRERSADERERARQEREARRAARERGEKPPRESSGGLLGGLLGGRGRDSRPGESPAPDLLAAEPRGGDPLAAEPRGGDPLAAEPRGGDPLAAEPRGGDPLAAEPPAPDPLAAEPLTAEPPLPLTDDPAAVPPPEERPLQPPLASPRRARRDPAAVRAAAERVALRARRKREGAGVLAPENRPPRQLGDFCQDRSDKRRPVGGGAVAGGGSRGRLFRVAAVAGVLLALVGAWFAWSLFQPLKGDGEGTVRVTIPTGASVTHIGEILEENDVVSDAFFFRTRVTLGGSRGDLKPGSYKLKRDMSYGAAIDALTEGPPRDVVTVTIPEGRARAEIAPIVRDAGLEGSYMRASTGSDAINLRRYEAGGADSLEGFLFPATYELKSGASVKNLVEKQLEAFKENFAKVNLRKARRKNLTAYEVLIIASMVEREAGVAKDRPLIASVIYNRLSNGIPLGIDATIRFESGNWEEPLKQSELDAPTPYNTRKNAGLPPGPIGNPGLDSIRAAADPPETDYLYFVVKPCGEGEHAFSETDAEFQRDVARYNAERDAQGGQSPTEC